MVFMTAIYSELVNYLGMSGVWHVLHAEYLWPELATPETTNFIAKQTTTGIQKLHYSGNDAPIHLFLIKTASTTFRRLIDTLLYYNLRDIMRLLVFGAIYVYM